MPGIHLKTLTALLLLAGTSATAQSILLKNVTLIDGKGGKPRPHTDILIQGDTIAAIGRGLQSSDATVTDGSGTTVMPTLIGSHVHIGLLKDNTSSAANYTRENILRQLKKYQDYGIGHVLALGTDRPLLFNAGLRDSSVAGQLPGAVIHTAGRGFTVPGGVPPNISGFDLLFRPASATTARLMMDSLAGWHPDAVKMWVDDGGGRFAKMDSAIYTAIIESAHHYKIPVASHLYYLADARKLAAAGVDIFAHSIRDKDIDAALLQLMKKRGIVYIPTLSLDLYTYIYAYQPNWINDPFFKLSLEPGVYDMITSPAYRDRILHSPDLQKRIAAFKTALRNVKKVHDAGITISLGTDSGASLERAQGFSEHLELELLVQAGLTPLQAITAGTRNAARTLQIDHLTGTLAKGRKADLLVLADSPEKNIRNTRKIVAVYKNGQKVSEGPK